MDIAVQILDTVSWCSPTAIIYCRDIAAGNSLA
jgi:hypothetical protein